MQQKRTIRIHESLHSAIEQLSKRIEDDWGIKPSNTQTTKILGEAIIFHGLHNPKDIQANGKRKKGKLPKKIIINL